MSQKSYEVVFKKSALKELQGLPQRIQQKIIDAVRLLSLNPYTELLQIKKMKGVDSLYRVRIQDYRIIYLIENQTIKVTIIKIGHRKENVPVIITAYEPNDDEVNLYEKIQRQKKK